MSKANVIAQICTALAFGRREEASALARTEYPFQPADNPGRRYSEYQMMKIFLRDGFIDRYGGERLVFPGTLRLLSTLMPEEFPAHPNWKMSESHIVYYELFPTIDHAKPVARGGADVEDNWVTTSMIRNSAKANWTLEELGWVLLPPGVVAGWDGLTRWFLDYTTQNPDALSSDYLRTWRSAALRALSAST